MKIRWMLDSAVMLKNGDILFTRMYWAAVRLANGNTILCSRGGSTCK